MTRALACLVAVLALFALGCPGAATSGSKTALEAARERAADSNDPDRVGAWLLAELVAPHGSTQRAAQARKRLAGLGKGGLMASLARGFDADVHGRFADAGKAYLAALAAARETSRPEAPLYGWFIADRLAAVQSASPDLWKEAEPIVTTALRDPGGLGWRARGALVEWWSHELFQGGGDAKKMLEQVREEHGCLEHALMAGPFGDGSLRDHRVHFAAEKPAPWPARFSRDRSGRVPRTLKTESTACLLYAAEVAGSGVYYVQTFVDLEAERDVILAILGAHAVWVDDAPVLERDLSDWGVWPRFGVRLRLSAGRHRILARLVAPETSIRLLAPNGASLRLHGSAEQGAPYRMSPPTILEDPNVLEPFLRASGVTHDPKVPAAAIDRDDPFHRYAAAYLAHVEGQDDLASVLFEPLVEKTADATPVSLAQQAVFVDGDPIFESTVARDLARDLRERAAEGDPELWGPPLWLAVVEAEKQSPSELVGKMEALATRFPEVPATLTELASIYGQLGWKAERLATLEKAAARFAEDIDILESLLSAYEEEGRLKEADALAARIRNLDPYAEVDFRRALARRDYQAAIAELERIGELEADRRDIAYRIADLMVRAGKQHESLEKLELALEKDPSDASARLALADARYARGERNALSEALVEAIQTGSDDASLRYAIELLEGMTDLEPYRRDGMAVIREVEASGEHLPGTAARILDYAAIWVSPDGSARMLEHEIIRVQSREGIERHAEQAIPRGVVLRMRTIKADGTVYEPELVSGKPTVTMPHLEVGDYIETESIWVLRGATAGGRQFLAPRWFFREENTSYHTSEFVVIIPAAIDARHELIVETTGEVPAPKVDENAGFVARSWRVDGSIGLIEEPLRPPVGEFLPSVRVGWGIDPEEQLTRVRDLGPQAFARDPRMVRIARTIVAGKLKGKRKVGPDEAARRIYRWVLETIQPGEERNGAKIITSKSGDRTEAFLYLCRLAGLDARLALVRDRLTPPPSGPISEAELYSVPAVRLHHGDQSRWLVVADRYAPYGFLPSSIRGQPAVMIQPAGRITSVESPPLEWVKTPAAGDDNRVAHEGTMTLRANGSAELELVQTYAGRYAIGLRSALSQVQEGRRKDVIEAQLLGMALPGGRLEKMSLPNLEALDEPARIEMEVEVPNIAKVAAGELVLEVPFLGALSPLVRLPKRETPLYISERTATQVKVSLKIQLPPGAEVVTPLDEVVIEEPRLVAIVKDRVEGGTLIIDREGSLPAGRVQPGDYAAFQKLVLRADEALNRTIRIKL